MSQFISIFASVLAMAAAYFVGNELRKWINRYERSKDSGTIEDVRKDISEDAKKDEATKPNLDEIEDEFADKGGS